VEVFVELPALPERAVRVIVCSGNPLGPARSLDRQRTGGRIDVETPPRSTGSHA